MSTPELSPADSLERPRARKQFRLPKELDILPPRPVLFPWLPSFEDIDCCKASRRKTRAQQEFSFDLSSGKTFGTEKVSSSEAGTPTTAPMEDDDEYEDAMPDMSKVHTTSSDQQRKQHRHRRQQQQPLLNLQDVIAEVLKVIFFMLSMKRSLLRQNGEERKDVFYPAKSKQENETNTSSTNNLVDAV
mmetsp:Transcript_14968/g.37692  ORF Transcript_14968/g.37692 Transcript_14968/m.37692 type:complete len:188 (-) Transcript_14968:291-854(-)